MPSQSNVRTLFAEIYARCGMPHDGGEIEPFVLQPDGNESVCVHYDSDEQVIWLTSHFEPIAALSADSLLRHLLENNLRSIENGFACALDAGSAVPVVQSWLRGNLIHLPDFEVAVERHVAAVQQVRGLLTLPTLETAHSTHDCHHAVWG